MTPCVCVCMICKRGLGIPRYPGSDSLGIFRLSLQSTAVALLGIEAGQGRASEPRLYLIGKLPHWLAGDLCNFWITTVNGHLRVQLPTYLGR